MTAKVAEGAKEEKSFTAKVAKDAEERNSLNAKDTKDAKGTLIKTKPQGRQDNSKWGIENAVGVQIRRKDSCAGRQYDQKHLVYATLGAVPSRPSGFAFDLIIRSFRV